MAPVRTAGKATQAKPSGPVNAVSMNPDDMLQGGLMDDFNGTITKVRYVPWDYNGKMDHHVLAVAVDITPDEGEGDPFTQHYSAGDLEQFAPSTDGIEAVDLENGEGEALEGEYAVRVGKRDQMNNNTNWATFILAALDAGFDKSQLAAACSCFEGIHGHFNRVPQKKRSGLVTQAPAEGGRPRNNDILVLTEISDAPAPAKKGAASKPNGQAGKPVAAKPSAKAAPAAAAAADVDPLDAALNELIVAALAEAGDEGLAKSALAKLALQGLQGADRAKGVKRITAPDFLEAGGDGAFVFDADSGTILAV